MVDENTGEIAQQDGAGPKVELPADEMSMIEKAAGMLKNEALPEEELAGGEPPADAEPQAPEDGGEAKEEGGKDSVTSLWSRITQQDKELRELRSRLKDKSSIEDLRSVARKDPAKVLADLGIGIDQVIDALASQQGVQPERANTPEEKTPKEIEQLRQELAQLRQEQAMTRQEAMVRSEVMRIDDAIKANPERWEVIASQRDEGSVKLVLETAAELWKQTGEIPDYEIVLDAVEEHLAGEARARLQRLSGLKKFRQQDRGAQPQAASPKVPKRGAPVVNPNNPTAKLADLSPEQRMQLAIQALAEGDKEDNG